MATGGLFFAESILLCWDTDVPVILVMNQSFTVCFYREKIQSVKPVSVCAACASHLPLIASPVRWRIFILRLPTHDHSCHVDGGEGCVFLSLSVCVCGGMVVFPTCGAPTAIYNLLFKDHLVASFRGNVQRHTTTVALVGLSGGGAWTWSCSVSFGDGTPALCSSDSCELPSKLIQESPLVQSISPINRSDVSAVRKQNRVGAQALAKETLH